MEITDTHPVSDRCYCETIQAPPDGGQWPVDWLVSSTQTTEHHIIMRQEEGRPTVDLTSMMYKPHLTTLGHCNLDWYHYQ